MREADLVREVGLLPLNWGLLSVNPTAILLSLILIILQGEENILPLFTLTTRDTMVGVLSYII